MKTKLLILSFIFSTTMAMSQVVANQVDDFEDGTIQNWIIGNPGSATFPPINVATGGPTGTDDNFYEYTSTGEGGAGSKMVIFNANEQWSSNFTSESIVSVKFDVSVLINNLNLRVAFQGPGGTKICTTNAVAVTAGAGWTTVAIPITESDFTIVEVGGGTSIADVLTSVFTMRILSSSTPTWAAPDNINATLRLDNIIPSTTLGVEEFTDVNEFSIYPNPSTSLLNIDVLQLDATMNLDIYNILGKKVLSKKINNLKSSINVSQWHSGVYLIRLSTDDATITKRFVKQ